MTAPQGLCNYGGVTADLRAGMTLSHGPAPSTCTFEITSSLLPKIREHGTLVFTYDGIKPIVFRDCRVLRPHVRAGAGGTTATIQILDRRWKWEFGRVDGHYNQRDHKRELIEDTQKTPQELATLCLRAMNESRFDVSQLPNNQRPEVEWVAENPASALNALCGPLGCRIVLELNGRVKIWKAGNGKSLPVGGTSQNAAAGLSVPGMPDSLEVVGGPARFQSKLLLEAVGVEVDDKVYLIDNLPYKPADGWEKENKDWFMGVATDADRARAKKYVWRWYQAKRQADGGFDVPGFDGEIDRWTQLLPYSTELVDTYEDELGVSRPLPAKIEGIYHPNGLAEETNTAKDTEVTTSWSLNPDTGIVVFADPIYKREASGSEFITKPAELYLTCTYSLTEPKTHQKFRQNLSRRLGRRRGTGAKILRHEDLVGTAVGRYNGPDLTGTEDNRSEFDKEARHYLDAAETEFVRDSTADVQYAGLIPISPDGAIQQVSWNVGLSGATTRASRNTEFNLAIPSYEERQRQEAVAAVVAKAKGNP